jgi:transcriptional regulator with XRE-family HTH domain
MTPPQLRAIRKAMGLTQAEFGDRIKMAGNSVARMERGEMIITAPMALLISYVAREAGVDTPDSGRGSRAAKDKRKHGREARPSGRKNRRGQGAS